MQIKNENSVCVHIRRGDYLTEVYKDRFLVCTDDYYKKALQLMRQKYPDAHFYIFSDSLGWVRDNMSILDSYNCTFIDNGGRMRC